MISKALSEAVVPHLGTPYKEGGRLPGGFSCSGFVCWALMTLGYKGLLNKDVTAHSLFLLSREVKTPEIGDLAFWKFIGGSSEEARQDPSSAENIGWPRHVELFVCPFDDGTGFWSAGVGNMWRSSPRDPRNEMCFVRLAPVSFRRSRSFMGFRRLVW